MNLHKLILTKNDCYKANRYITPKGIMVHSTGANNPNLKRYVGPDDGLLGVNTYNNHWNMSGVGACVHAFIGKLKDGSIATYQTLPWDMRGWHCAGSGNNNLISFEICEEIIDKNFRLTNEQKDRVLELIKYHDMTVAATKKSVKRALNKHGKDFLEDWFILKQADMDDHIYPNKNHKYYINIPYIRDTMEEILSANECFSIKDMMISGHDIMQLTGCKPGKHIGVILNTLLEKIMDEEISNDPDVLKTEALKIWQNLSE